MTNQVADLGATRGVQILHGVLVGGLVMITMTFVLVLRLLHIQELVPGARVAGYVMALLSVLGVALAVTIFRPRVPSRTTSDQSSDSYWAKGQNRGAAILVWVVCEAAGIISAVGYLMTGHPVPLVAVVLAVVALAVHGPKRLAAE